MERGGRAPRHPGLGAARALAGNVASRARELLLVACGVFRVNSEKIEREPSREMSIRTALKP